MQPPAGCLSGVLLPGACAACCLLPPARQIVPPEWRAWLARTRQDPPSEEEMARWAAAGVVSSRGWEALGVDSSRGWAAGVYLSMRAPGDSTVLKVQQSSVQQRSRLARGPTTDVLRSCRPTFQHAAAPQQLFTPFITLPASEGVCCGCWDGLLVCAGLLSVRRSCASEWQL